RPQERRMRLDTMSLRGLFNQQIHGSKRSLRSVEDFTEFEQRTAYFNGDHISADKKGSHQPNRTNQVALMAQMQNMLDFPPAPKLDTFSRLNPSKATDQELTGEKIFYGKGRCAECPRTIRLSSRLLRYVTSLYHCSSEHAKNVRCTSEMPLPPVRSAAANSLACARSLGFMPRIAMSMETSSSQ